MATDAELRLILRARDEASGALEKVEKKLSNFGKLADDIGKKFRGGQFIGSILSGVGLGSGAQLIDLLKTAIEKPFKEAADAAKIIEEMSARSLEHQKKMLDVRKQILGISREENLGQLEYEARQASSAFQDANRARTEPTFGFFGNRTGTRARENTPEEQSEIARLKAAAEQAEIRLAEARLAAQQRGNAEILTDVKAADQALRRQLSIQQVRDEQRRKAAASAAASEDARAAALVETEQLLTDFFSSVEKGAAILKEKKVDQALETFFYSVDNPTPASGVRGGLEQTIAAIGPAAEQASRAVQTTLGGAVYAISDGIAGWATGILSTGQAASQIWTNFKMAALQAFTDMVAQYAVKKAAMFAIDVLFSAKGLALQLASAAKSLVAWIPSAIAASISSFGTAALIGAAAVAAVLAATGGFADGGIVRGPGTGTSDSILARLSNGEYVVPAAAVQRIGESNLDAMSYGGLSASTAMIPASGGAGGGRGATVLVDNRREADRFRRGSPMETQIVQVVQANRYRIAT